jgi:WD40 repeat protein
MNNISALLWRVKKLTHGRTCMHSMGILFTVFVLNGCSPGQVQTSQATKTFRYAEMTINAAAIAHDATLSLIAEPDKVCLWENQQHQKVIPCITGSEAEHIELVGISQSKQYFFTSNQMTVRFYQLLENKKVQLVNEWYADNNIINDIAISANGDTLLLGYRNGQASIIDTKTADKKTFQLHRLDINAVALSDDGQMALTGSSDKTAVLWRTNNGESVSVYQHRTRVNHVDISEDGHLGFTIDSINDRAFWQLDNKNAPELSEMQTSLKFLEINHSAFSSDQKFFLTGSPKQKIMLWRVSDGKLMGQWQSAKIGRSSVLQVAFASMNSIAIITSDGNYQEFPTVSIN